MTPNSTLTAMKNSLVLSIAKSMPYCSQISQYLPALPSTLHHLCRVIAAL